MALNDGMVLKATYAETRDVGGISLGDEERGGGEGGGEALMAVLGYMRERLVLLTADCRYMRGRLTLEKVNAAINDMATYAEAIYQLISAPKKNVAGDRWEKALEIRDIAMHEAVKGKHFFLEKGPSLKVDNTGKEILTVLRHLGRVSEMRIVHHRVIILLKPH